MPSFVCDACQSTLKKAQLDGHAQRCRRATFSCIDCYKSFASRAEYSAHTSCITEVQKYHDKKQRDEAISKQQNANNNNKNIINNVQKTNIKKEEPAAKNETKQAQVTPDNLVKQIKSGNKEDKKERKKEEKKDKKKEKSGKKKSKHRRL